MFLDLVRLDTGSMLYYAHFIDIIVMYKQQIMWKILPWN